MRPLPALLLTVALTAATRAPRAQCEPQWLPGEPATAPRGRVLCHTLWDPDGSGPAPLSLVVGGDFAIGTVSHARVALWDGSSWTVTTGGFSNMREVTALAAHAGRLMAASTDRVHSYDGSRWTQIATARRGSVNFLPRIDGFTVFQNDLFAYGDFADIAGLQTSGIARWNGTSWFPVGGGVIGRVRTATVHTFGGQPALWVGGDLTWTGSQSVQNLGVWTGTTWQSVPGANATVRSLASRIGTTASGTVLVAGGDFTAIGGTPAFGVARLTPSLGAWSALTGFPESTVQRVAVRGSGISSYEIAAAGTRNVARWVGSGWNTLQGVSSFPGSLGYATYAPSVIASLVHFGGRWTIGLTGDSPLIGGNWSFDGQDWRQLDSPGLSRPVLAILADGSDTILGGDFVTIGGTTVHGIARGGPGRWTAMANGLTIGGGVVMCLARLANGDLIAGGSFDTARGAPADNIARWDGTRWLPVGGGISGTVRCLLALPDGGLIAGGSFQRAGSTTVGRIARFDGTTWSDIDGGFDGSVHALARTRDGDLVAAGTFQQISRGPRLARSIAILRSGAWQPLGSGLSSTASALAALPNGDIVVGGQFEFAGAVATGSLARWNGTAWTPMPGYGQALQLPPAVHALHALPNGDLLVGALPFHLDPSITHATVLARLRDGQWRPLLQARYHYVPGPDAILALTHADNGDVLAGGWFHMAGTTSSANVARHRITCEATLASYGTSCTSAAGRAELRIVERPWLGTTVRGLATGMPSRGVAVSVLGLARSAVPLATLLAGSSPGCNLLATTEAVAILAPSQGTVATAFDLPFDVSLAGLALHHQVVGVEYDVFSVPFRAIGTNGMTLTLGTW